MEWFVSHDRSRSIHIGYSQLLDAMHWAHVRHTPALLFVCPTNLLIPIYLPGWSGDAKFKYLGKWPCTTSNNSSPVTLLLGVQHPLFLSTIFHCELIDDNCKLKGSISQLCAIPKRPSSNESLFESIKTNWCKSLAFQASWWNNAWIYIK